MDYTCRRCLASEGDLCLCQDWSGVSVAPTVLPGRNKRIRNISAMFVDGRINNRIASRWTRNGG